jgi:hypothetical protein
VVGARNIPSRVWTQILAQQVAASCEIGRGGIGSAGW